ncbi:MAG TPA: hypothetical protein VNO30_49050 [Kofleriaceae bacterium]|nr:hypothetical protein [Kofleriaceae bacterium]
MAGLAACGDDENDIKRPDAATTPDAPKPVFKGYDADEGGEVRIEYVKFGNGNAGIRAGAFFYDNPGTKRFWEYVNTNGCTDSSTDMNWPTAANPIAERTYLDPGNIILSGGPQTFTLKRNPAMGPDVPGRVHPADKWFFDTATSADTDGGTYLTEKTKYDLIVTGSPSMPAQIFDDVMYMPADFSVISPALSTTPFPIPAGMPQTFTWTTPPSDQPAGYEIVSLVAFIVPGQGPAVLCIEPNDGSITVPANFIDIARAKIGANTGTLARQTLTHQVRELMDRNGPTGKRIDLLTIWCYATPFVAP